MRNSFTLDGISSFNYNIWINGSGAYDSAAPDVSTVKIPGRNGELIYSNRRFNNVKIQYDCLMLKEFQSGFEDFLSFLYSDLSYRRLEDTYHPDYFRMARVTGALSPSKIIWHNNQGVFKISFDCMPQKFLKLGESVQSFAESGTIENPTLYDALPLIRIYGYGLLSFGGHTIEVGETDFPYIDVDCDIMEAYYGDVNCNGYVSVPADEFPKLQKGENEITIPNTVTQVNITPRWWTI